LVFCALTGAQIQVGLPGEASPPTGGVNPRRPVEDRVVVADEADAHKASTDVDLVVERVETATKAVSAPDELERVAYALELIPGASYVDDDVHALGPGEGRCRVQ